MRFSLPVSRVPRPNPALPNTLIPHIRNSVCALTTTRSAPPALLTDPETLAKLANVESALNIGPTYWGGRGMMAIEEITGRQNIVTVPISNALVITDNALEGISIFGDSAHESFQEVHGAFPPQLLEFITGEERWDVRMVALLLWVVKASGAIPGGGWRGTGPYDLHPDPPNTPMPPASYRLWQSYAALLPKECEMCCLLNYSPEEAKELQAKEFVVEANAQYKWVKFMHEQYFSSKGGELSKLKLAEKMEDTFWATSMVRSRTFSEDVGGEGITLMVPFADLANHSFGHNSTFSIGLDKSMFCLRSLKPIPAGSEAIISYGQDKCNASLQRDYGFIIPGQPNDIIRFPSKGKNCPEGLTKLHPQVLLPAVSMAGDLAKQQLYPTDSRVGSSSWLAGVATAGSPGSLVPIEWARKRCAVLSLLKWSSCSDKSQDGKSSSGSSSGTDSSSSSPKESVSRGFFSWPPKPRTSSGEPPSKEDAVQFEVQSERRSVNYLLQLISSELQSLPTTSDHDQELLASHDLDPVKVPLSTRHAQAVRARLERKLLLEQCQKVLQTYDTALQRV